MPSSCPPACESYLFDRDMISLILDPVRLFEKSEFEAQVRAGEWQVTFSWCRIITSGRFLASGPHGRELFANSGMFLNINALSSPIVGALLSYCFLASKRGVCIQPSKRVCTRKWVVSRECRHFSLDVVCLRTHAIGCLVVRNFALSAH